VSTRFLKYIFFILLVIMLAIMIRVSRDAGISGDEEVHYRQSELVYRYFATLGKDRTALHTPSTHLQYYGQSFDNMVTILVHAFQIDNIYAFRHVMCSMAGWLTILVTAWLAVSISGYVAGILTILLFAVSPAFLGHAQNNLKDIPFALAYIAAVFFMIRVIFNKGKGKGISYILLTLSLALAIGIRAGGLMLIGYLTLFTLAEMLYRYMTEKQFRWALYRRRILTVLLVSVAGYILGLLLWPFALENPFLNPWKSYQVMAHFPTTIRQIFEGQSIWSDFLPWYYLPKSMLITIPILVWLGFGLFLIPFIRSLKHESAVLYSFLLFTILFPPVFAVLKQVNLYGSWRHFLFIYPGIVLLAALGFTGFLRIKKHYLLRLAVIAFLLLLAIHPFRFMVRNHPYYYLYYNQLVGGLRQAYGNYETDYYYHTMRKGSDWLIQYLEKEGVKRAVVGANFSIAWFLRNKPGFQYRYFSWGHRCQTDWDYAVVANSYIPPGQLQNRIWPPKNAIHVIYADEVPVCVVLKRLTRDDLTGINALKEGRAEEAVLKLKTALDADPVNEVIYYHLACALEKVGNTIQADSMLLRGLQIHEQYEPALLLLAKNARERGDLQNASLYCDRLLSANPKYFSAYVLRAELYGEAEIPKARNILKACLEINPKYKPAIFALADTYRKSNPDIAKKYDNLAKSIP